MLFDEGAHSPVGECTPLFRVNQSCALRACRPLLASVVFHRSTLEVHKGMTRVGFHKHPLVAEITNLERKTWCRTGFCPHGKHYRPTHRGKTRAAGPRVTAKGLPSA